MADRYASLKQGLVGCWIPSVSGSGLLLPDLSGRGNHGTLTNMGPEDWVSGQYGRALDFDGSNDYLDTTTVQPTEQYTVTGFAAVDSFSNSPLIYTFRDPLNAVWDTGFLETNNTGSQLFYGVRNIEIGQTTFRNYTLSQSLVAGQFFHFATVKFAGSDTGELYVNGIRQTSFTGSLNAVPGRGTLRFAAYTPPSFYMDGRLDDLRLYNRALSEPEIRLLSSEPGIGFKPAKKLSRFSQRFTYKPPKAKVFEGVRVRDLDYASLRQGLVGAWCPSLPNGGSGNTLPDQSGRGNHGTLTNMVPEDWVSGQYGRALDFDGVNDKVELGARDLLRQPLSISAWAYRRSSNANHTIIDGATDPSNSFGAHLRFTTANKIRWYFNNANLSLVDTTTTPSLNTWHHVTGTFDGVTSRIYFNGVLEASTTGDAFGTAAGNYRIGCLSTVYGTDVGVMDGLIDDIRVYNRALTEPEIRLLASRPGIGLQPSPTRFIAREKKTGLRRKILTGQT